MIVTRKNIWDITKEEVEVLFKMADFEDYKITKLEKDTDCGIVDCLVVYAESEWDDEEKNGVIIEDEIVRLFPTMYENSCDFSNGFNVPNFKYIQWALWCGLIEPINFDLLRN